MPSAPRPAVTARLSGHELRPGAHAPCGLSQGPPRGQPSPVDLVLSAFLHCRPQSGWHTPRPGVSTLTAGRRPWGDAPLSDGDHHTVPYICRRPGPCRPTACLLPAEPRTLPLGSAPGVGPWQEDEDADVPSVWGPGTSRVDVPGEGPREAFAPQGTRGPGPGSRTGRLPRGCLGTLQWGPGEGPVVLALFVGRHAGPPRGPQWSAGPPRGPLPQGHRDRPIKPPL